MKKIIQKSFILIMLAALLMSAAVPVLAAGTVTYDGNSKDFIFSPGSKNSPTDLFDNLKDV